MFELLSQKRLRVLFVIILASIAIGMSAWCEPIPQKINYQGTLNNKSGGPANGSFNMTFRIYSTATGTNPIWTETWSANNSSPVVVTDGVFNVMLGSITPLSNDFFALHPKTYLGISVANDSEFLPRQMLASVGYAFAAGNGIPKGGIIMWSGTTVPDGWVLCDGSSGTPNLKEKFIIGASTTYPIGVPGGSLSHTHPGVNHLHALGGSTGGTYDTDIVRRGSSDPFYLSNSTHTHTLPAYTGSADRDLTTGATMTLPPYYALAFIMKL